MLRGLGGRMTRVGFGGRLVILLLEFCRAVDSAEQALKLAICAGCMWDACT